MSPRQTALYFREWGYVRGYCKRHRQPEPDRHELHRQALGYDKSSKEFTNAEFDKVLGVFRSMSMPGSVNSQVRQLEEPRTRKLGKIRELLKCIALYIDDAEGYAREIIRDTVNRGSAQQVSAIEDLSEHPPGPDRPSPLDKLIMDLSRALNGKRGFRATAGDSLHDMNLKAGLQCGCSACAFARRRGRPAPVMAMAGPDLESNEPW